MNTIIKRWHCRQYDDPPRCSRWYTFWQLTAFLELRWRLGVIIETWWDAGVVICLERGADLHIVQLMPLPLTVSCFSKIQIGFTFPVSAHLGSPGQKAVKRMCVLFKDMHKCSFYSLQGCILSATVF